MVKIQTKQMECMLTCVGSHVLNACMTGLLLVMAKSNTWVNHGTVCN